MMVTSSLNRRSCDKNAKLSQNRKLLKDTVCTLGIIRSLRTIFQVFITFMYFQNSIRTTRLGIVKVFVQKSIYSLRRFCIILLIVPWLLLAFWHQIFIYHPFLEDTLNDNSFHETRTTRSMKRWYFSNISVQKVHIVNRMINVWPDRDSVDDRIENQLLLYPDRDHPVKKSRPKVIIVSQMPDRHGRRRAGTVFDRDFEDNQCPVTNCIFTYDRRKVHTADGILFKDDIDDWYIENFQRPKDQIWILSLLESPYHTRSFAHAKHLINWTATYRQDSDIVTPYDKFALYNRNIRKKMQETNYASLKYGKGRIAWFVSNCETGNKRMDYAQELSKYIPVDIYGRCGTLDDQQCRKQKNCSTLLEKEYKFYLSFENNNCRWYITEKLWTALKSSVIPIVMGAPRTDYEMVAPYNSFIHVDDFNNPKELANYLRYLDENDDAYNGYFSWKNTGEIISTYTFCRICALLHNVWVQKSYDDFDNWWHMGGFACTSKPLTKEIIWDT